tara:strand:+ start:733 stop:1176 length:444 start_codon:yes stop_codon:yes gene_type:complete
LGGVHARNLSLTHAPAALDALSNGVSSPPASTALACAATTRALALTLALDDALVARALSNAIAVVIVVARLPVLRLLPFAERARESETTDVIAAVIAIAIARDERATRCRARNRSGVASVARGPTPSPSYIRVMTQDTGLIMTHDSS